MCYTGTVLSPQPRDTTRQAKLSELEGALEGIAHEIVSYRRHLHQFPELSLQEFATTAYIAGILAREGISYRMGSGTRGLLVDLGDPSSEIPVAVRADCDALPIVEANTHPHVSTHHGVMHACGHDAHTAMLLGAVVAFHRSGCRAPWRAIFQPAEEAGDGALGMISDGALDGVSSIIALHVDPGLPVGQAAAVPGPQTASCEDFHIVVTGRGGHAARPHLTIDPVAISASLITQIYQAVPRGIDSRKPVVVSICQIHAGHATNVIPETARLDGTIRSLDAGSASEATEILRHTCDGLARSSGAAIEVSFERRIPGVNNDPAVTAACAEAGCEIFGRDSVQVTNLAGFGAEDFADYQQLIPGCMMRLGVKYPDRDVTPLHTPTFDIDERALLPGAKLLLLSLLNLSKTPPC